MVSHAPSSTCIANHDPCSCWFQVQVDIRLLKKGNSKLPSKAGPLNHPNDTVEPDQLVVNKEHSHSRFIADGAFPPGTYFDYLDYTCVPLDHTGTPVDFDFWPPCQPSVKVFPLSLYLYISLYLSSLLSLSFSPLSRSSLSLSPSLPLQVRAPIQIKPCLPRATCQLRIPDWFSRIQNRAPLLFAHEFSGRDAFQTVRGLRPLEP